MRRRIGERKAIGDGEFLGACLAVGIAPGCAVSCLSLAAAAFPRMGPRQSSILFLSYTVTALLGAAPVVQRWRPPMRAAAGGAALLSLYPASLALASFLENSRESESEALSLTSRNGTLSQPPSQPWVTLASAAQRACLYGGAAAGGAGAGVLWTAVGAYLSRASSQRDDGAAATANGPRSGREEAGEREDGTDDEYIAPTEPQCEDDGNNDQTHQSRRCEDDGDGFGRPAAPFEASKRAGRLAAILLAEETLLVGSSAALVRVGKWGWGSVFGLYALLSVAGTALVRLVIVDSAAVEREEGDGETTTPQSTPPSSSSSSSSPWDCGKLTMAARLLVRDAKAKYLLGLPLVLGVAGGFLNSHVSGRVVPYSLSSSGGAEGGGGDDSAGGASWVGLLAAFHGLAAAAASALLGGCPVQASDEDDDDEDSTRTTTTTTMAGAQRYHCPRSSSGRGAEEDHVGGLTRGHDHSPRQPAPRSPRRRRLLSGRAILILAGGCLALGWVGLAFVVRRRPSPGGSEDKWTLPSLLALYALHGVGRAAFEGVLRAAFAVLYPAARRGADSDNEGAFACILLFHGVGSVASHWLAAGSAASGGACRPQDPSSDPEAGASCDPDTLDSRADVLATLLLVLSAAAALGYARAWRLLRRDEEEEEEEEGEGPGGGFGITVARERWPRDGDRPWCRRLLLLWPASYQAVDDRHGGTGSDTGGDEDDPLEGTELREVTGRDEKNLA